MSAKVSLFIPKDEVNLSGRLNLKKITTLDDVLFLGRKSVQIIKAIVRNHKFIGFIGSPEFYQAAPLMETSLIDVRHIEEKPLLPSLRFDELELEYEWHKPGQRVVICVDNQRWKERKYRKDESFELATVESLFEYHSLHVNVVLDNKLFNSNWYNGHGAHFPFDNPDWLPLEDLRYLVHHPDFAQKWLWHMTQWNGFILKRHKKLGSRPKEAESRLFPIKKFWRLLAEERKVPRLTK